MIHTDTDTAQASILIPIPGIFTNNIHGIGIGIGTIPILELLPIPILDKDSYRYRYWNRYHTDTDTNTGICISPILILKPGIRGTLTTTILVSCDSIEINLGQVYTQSKWFPDDSMMVSGEYLDF